MIVSETRYPKHFIMVAPFFPPMGGSGVQRSAKLAKYAHQMGWEPHILCMAKPSSWSLPNDQDLFAEVDHLDIHRLPRVDLRLATRFFHTLGAHRLAEMILWPLPLDGYLGWIPFAIQRAREILKRHPIEAVYTTSDPWSTVLVGGWLRKHHGIPWIADYRDPWTTSPSLPQYRRDSLLSRWKTWADRRIERAAHDEADIISVVVEPHRQDIIRLFAQPPDKVVTLHNAYDESDFIGLPFPFEPCRDVFRISYFGIFHPEGSFAGYHPRSFLTMFEAFLQRCPQPQRVRFRVVGQGARWLREHPELTSRIRDHLELQHYVPHREVFGQMADSAALLLIAADAISLTGKLFEYMRSGLPIFCLSPSLDNELASILRQTGTGRTVPKDDIEEGAKVLREYYECWHRGSSPTEPDLARIKQYSRENLARRFVQIFEHLSGEGT